ncbi:MAG: hypothetical protein WAO19_10475 [Candidatus Kryptoniota bacterium]
MITILAVRRTTFLNTKHKVLWISEHLSGIHGVKQIRFSPTPGDYVGEVHVNDAASGTEFNPHTQTPAKVMDAVVKNFAHYLVPLPKINIVFCNLPSSFDAAATAHPEQPERIEGGRRGFPQDEHVCKSTRLFFKNGTSRFLKRGNSEAADFSLMIFKTMSRALPLSCRLTFLLSLNS